MSNPLFPFLDEAAAFDDELPEDLRAIDMLLRSASPSRLARLRTRLMDRLRKEMLIGPSLELTTVAACESTDRKNDAGLVDNLSIGARELTGHVVADGMAAAGLDSVVLTFAEALPLCARLSEITGALFCHAQRFEICRMRVYLFDSRLKRLFGVDAAGHDHEATALLRLGQIGKSIEESPIETSDSYWCLAKGRPVIVQIRPDVTPPYRSVERDDGLLEITVTEQCGQLAAHRGKVYVDLPLPQWRGKISLDFVGDQVPSDVGNRIHAFQRLVNIAAPYFVAAYAEEVESRLAAARADLQGADSIDDFGRLCIKVATGIFDFDQADFYSSQEDMLGSKLLVMRQSSEVEQVHSPFSRCLRLDDQEVESWAAAHLKSVAIERWSSGIATWGADDVGLSAIDRAMDDFDSIYVIPLEHKPGKLDGVLSMRRRKQNDPYAQRGCDQIILHRFASEVVPSILSEVKRKAHIKTLAKYSDHSNELSFQDFGAFSELMGETARTLKRIFSRSDSQHLFLLNVLTGTGYFQHFRLGGSLPSTSRVFDSFPLEGSMTKRVCERDFVYLNDLDKARNEGWILRIAKSAACAIGARVAYGRNEVGGPFHFGALVVMSSKHDLNPHEHATILRFLADRLAENIARRRVHSYLLLGLEQEARRVEIRMQRELNDIRKTIKDEAPGVDRGLSALEQLLPVSRRAIRAASEVIAPPAANVLFERFKLHELVEQVGAVLGKEGDFDNQVPRELEVAVASKSVLSTILLKVFFLLRHSKRSRAPAVNGFVRRRGNESSLVVVVDGIERKLAAPSLDVRGIMDSNAEDIEKTCAVQYRMALSLARAYPSFGRHGGTVDLRPSPFGLSQCEITLPAIPA